MLLADKPRVASLMPASAVIEAPDTDTSNASMPIHPGTSAYLSGNQPSVSDEAQNALYWLGIMASIFASFAAALTALLRRFAPKRPEATLKLLDLWVAARGASKEELPDIDAKVDDLVHEMVKKQVSGKGEEMTRGVPAHPERGEARHRPAEAVRAEMPPGWKQKPANASDRLKALQHAQRKRQNPGA